MRTSKLHGLGVVTPVTFQPSEDDCRDARRSAVDPGIDRLVAVAVVGVLAHERAVADLQGRFAERPDGIRLAKRTSNLFRTRSPARGGLDPSELRGVISVDAASRTADVQGMC